MLIFTDSTRADFIGAYAPGNPLNDTPNLDALARDSLRFTHAVPQSMPTGAARRELLSGMRNFPFRDWAAPAEPGQGELPAEPGWTPIGDHQPIVTDVMGEAGIATAYVTDNPFLVGPRYETFRQTLDYARPQYSQGAYRVFNKPFERPAQRGAIERYLIPKLNDSLEARRLRSYVGWNDIYRDDEGSYAAARVIGGGMRLLGRLRERQPFFLGVDAFDPHEAFDPPATYMDRFAAAPKGAMERQGIVPIQPFDTPYSRVVDLDLDSETVDRVRELYAAELTFVDRWVGRLMNRLADMDLLDNTVVYYSSDHGLLLGEYGIIGKHAAYPNWPVYKVPHMIRDPRGRRAGETSGYFAGTHDIPRTLLSYQGIKAPGLMDGEDLTVLFEGKEPPERPYFTAAYARYVICGDGRWVLISHSDGRRLRLFDTDDDPRELRNVAAENPEKVEELRTVLEQEAGGTLPQFGDERVLGG